MKTLLFSLLFLSLTGLAHAKCFEIDGANKKDFDGKNLAGFQIEKKSLSKLDSIFPDLKAKEKMFSGEVTVCTDCTTKHIKCD
jgi:hypothetical protein